MIGTLGASLGDGPRGDLAGEIAASSEKQSDEDAQPQT
jgi:hypothetical protein